MYQDQIVCPIPNYITHNQVHNHWGQWYINGLVQDCNNTIAKALELLQSCSKPSIVTLVVWQHDAVIHV